jgi:hypothetical protein
MSNDEVDIEDIDEEEELDFKDKLDLKDYDDELDQIEAYVLPTRTTRIKMSTRV